MALSSEGVFTFIGNGNGTFGPVPIEALQYAPIGAAGVGDLNGDGNLDLAAGRVDTDEVAVLLGNGDGSFGPEVRIAGGVGPMALKVADFDADGKLDLAEVVLNWPYLYPDPIPPGTLLVSKGNGDGTFAAPVPYFTGPYPLRMSVADFNGDGVPDIAVADFGDIGPVLPDLRVYLGNPGGPLSPRFPKRIPSFPSDMDVGDFNLDGHPDIVVTTRRDRSASSASILLGNGDGTFQDPTLLAQFSETTKVAVGVADLNGDGKPDLVVADSGDGFPPPNNPGAVHVFLGEGNGSFLPGAVFQAGYAPYDVTLGDFNGDSNIDLFTETGGGYESFFPGLGDGTFGPQERYGLFGSPTILGSFDFNGDHLEDLIAFSSMGVFLIKKQGAVPTQVLDARLRFSQPRGRRRAFVEWSTDREGSLSGFNLVAVSPDGIRRQFNLEPIACAECTTGRGHSYSAMLNAPAIGRAIYIEVLYRDGHAELFGPAAVPPRRGGISPVQDPSP
ncbi:MAG: VCBS repeat-containing protein [Acidobacteria bacterium]|nr:VCBS repeat-containing protein [Acidobacteriota bacterium]